MITVEHISKKFGKGLQEVTILKDISFTVASGEFLAITGRSGSGKSTLLYQLGLLDTPTAGTISIDGINTATLDDYDRSVFRLTELGYVFQDYALIPTLSAVENVLLPLFMQGVERKQATEKAISALEKVDLQDRLSNLPSQLSGGQQQRVSIARALAHEPKIIFADEPTANLDTESSHMVLDTFMQLHKSGQTIVMVTHEKDYAALADRSIILSDGKIIGDKKNK